MTREEAIKLIEHISIAFVPTDQYGDYDDPEPYEEALQMAIEALSAEAVHKTDIVRRIKEALSAEIVDVEECNGCKYDTRIPQKQCLRCSRYWKDNYEYKDGDDE